MNHARLMLGNGDSEPLGGTLFFGRNPDNDLVLPHPAVSRSHGAVMPDSDHRYWVADFGSRNGTYLNGHRVARRQRLRHGDHLRVARFHFQFLEK